MSGAVGAWVQACLDGISVAQPAPALGGGQAAEESSEVRGRPAPRAPGYHRIFVVDRDHPDGCEVSDRFTLSDGDLWRVGPADEGAIVILVAGSRPVPGVGLEAVLANAAERDDVSVGTRELQPIQVTKASR